MNLTTIKSAIEEINISRRRFLTTAGASAVTMAVLPSALAAENAAAPNINIGLIGCGSRGKFMSQLFTKHGGYNFVAVADYFQDKVDTVGETVGVPAERRFTGLSAYKQLLEQKLDAVVIESPAYFHPEQAAAAVAAGKHVYLAKPVAVDVPGCVTVEKSGQLATEKKLCFVVDFQTRTHPALQKLAECAHTGGLGKIISADAGYQCGPVGQLADDELKADPKNPELRLRAWLSDKVLSGDIITEQNIHAIDMACWFLDAAPVSANGTCGKGRDYIGNCSDHFSVTFQYPKNVMLALSSKQFGYGYDDIMCRIYGVNGAIDAHYNAKSTIRTKDQSFNGEIKSLYATGPETNIATFHESITKGNYANPTVATSVRSNLATILGRMAAYQNKTVTWEEMMRNPERLVADLSGLKA